MGIHITCEQEESTSCAIDLVRAKLAISTATLRNSSFDSFCKFSFVTRSTRFIPSLLFLGSIFFLFPLGNYFITFVRLSFPIIIEILSPKPIKCFWVLREPFWIAQLIIFQVSRRKCGDFGKVCINCETRIRRKPSACAHEQHIRIMYASGSSLALFSVILNQSLPL